MQKTFVIQYEVNDACNLRCSHCYHGLKVIKENPVTLERLFSDLEEMKALLGPDYTIVIGLSGGEVFMRKDLMDLVLHTMLNGYATYMLTNGTLVTPEKAEQLLVRGVQMTRISVDGGTEALHDGIRGKGQFQKTLQGVRTFREAGQPVALTCTLMRDYNDAYADVKALFDLARREDVFKLNFSRMFAQGDGKNTPEYVYDNGQVFKAKLEMLWDLAAEYPDISVVIKDPLAKNIERPLPDNLAIDVCCYIKKDFISVAANGDVYACRKLDKTVGNLLEDTLANIWQNNTLLQQMDDRRLYMEGKCRTCPINTVCQGGCLAASYGQYGRLFVPDPACWREETPADLVVSA